MYNTLKRKRYTEEEILNFKGVDKFGKTFKVTHSIMQMVNNKQKVRYYIQFSNGFGRWYSKEHIVSNMSGIKNNIVSNIMPDEFIGKKYKIKNDTLTIIDIHKRRYSYKLTYVKVVWDDSTEGVYRLVDIIKGRISKNRNNADYNTKPRLIHTGQTDKYGIYCIVPILIGIDYLTTEKAVYDHRNMMRRCYAHDKTSNNKSYLISNISVCDEWHNIYTFVKWHELNYVKGYVLDKDLINPFASKYSPDTCIYIPRIINNSLTVRASNKEYPNGIYKCKLPGRAPYPSGIDINGRYISAGYFNTIIDAFIYRKILREYYIKELSYRLLCNSELEADKRIIYYCNKYQVYDIRPKCDNIINNDDVIKYLKEKTKLKTDDYFKLRDKFIELNKDYFNTKFNIISKYINIELELD